jgi:hypothetical protein
MLRKEMFPLNTGLSLAQISREQLSFCRSFYSDPDIHESSSRFYIMSYKFKLTFYRFPELQDQAKSWTWRSQYSCYRFCQRSLRGS